MTNEKIVLRLSLAEVNQILELVGQRPYSEVFELVSTIQVQAEAQLSPEPPEIESP